MLPPETPPTRWSCKKAAPPEWAQTLVCAHPLSAVGFVAETSAISEGGMRWDFDLFCGLATGPRDSCIRSSIDWHTMIPLVQAHSSATRSSAPWVIGTSNLGRLQLGFNRCYAS